jgi:hypothetical protein
MDIEIDSSVKLVKENLEWFENHKHLSNEEMLKLGLIDECDLWWVNLRRALEVSDDSGD